MDYTLKATEKKRGWGYDTQYRDYSTALTDYSVRLIYISS